MILDKREHVLDVQSFEILFSRIQPGLYAYCRKYIADAELARDFVQECFMNLWTNRDCVTTSYEAYLFRAVHNQCVSYYRAQKVHARYEVSARDRIAALTIPTDVPYPLAELYLKEVQELLDHSVGNLPEKCREIFIMSRYRGIWDTDEFYDMQEDPYEQRNLIAAPEHQEQIKVLTKELYNWLESTGGMQIPLKRTDYPHADHRNRGLY